MILIYAYFYVPARQENNRTHGVICRVMALAAIHKTIARLGRLADMIIDGMCATTSQVVLGPGAWPVILGRYEIRSRRRIAMTGVACTAGDDLNRTVNVQRFAHEDVAVAVPGRIDVRMAITGGADRSGSRESRWNCNYRMSTG